MKNGGDSRSRTSSVIGLRLENQFGRLLLLVLAGFTVTGAYMFQRHMSLKLTWRLARQEAEQRVLFEERDRLLAELQQLAGFARLDSVWASSSRPPAYAEARPGDRPATRRSQSPGAGPGETAGTGRRIDSGAMDIADGR